MSQCATEAKLVGDDYRLTQNIAKFAAAAGFEGNLAPSAALLGRATLAVFPRGMDAVTIGPSRVRQPPPRMLDLLTTIRAHPDVPSSVQESLRTTAAGRKAVVRRFRPQGGSGQD